MNGASIWPPENMQMRSSDLLIQNGGGGGPRPKKNLFNFGKMLFLSLKKHF
jgi:hypothetical protein